MFAPFWFGLTDVVFDATLSCTFLWNVCEVRRVLVVRHPPSFMSACCLIPPSLVVLVAVVPRNVGVVAWSPFFLHCSIIFGSSVSQLTLGGIVTVDEAYGLFLDAMVGVRSPRTVGFYRRRLRSLVDQIGGFDVCDVTVSDLRSWRRVLVERDRKHEANPRRRTEYGALSSYTVAGYVRACRRFFNWLVDEGELSVSPAQRLDMPRAPKKQPKAISEEDLTKMLEAAEESSARDYAMVLFLADTGCRRGGLVGLRLQDLDLAERRAAVREKGGTLRFVSFNEGTAQALLDYLVERDHPSDRVWIGRRGPLTGTGVYEVFRRLARSAGVEDNWNPHAFRHAWAVRALKNGADLGTVSRALGRSTIKTTHEHYAIYADGELSERIRSFSPLHE